MFMHGLQSLTGEDEKEELMGRPNYGHLPDCGDMCCYLNKIVHTILRSFEPQEKILP